jgi:hypothetical protein
MHEELSEKVETVYAEEYAWPLGAALLLLMVEAAIDEAPLRRRAAPVPDEGAPGPKKRTKRKKGGKKGGVKRVRVDATA